MKTFTAVLTLLTLAGCASTYNPPSGQPLAVVSFDMTSDSTGTTGKFFSAWAYEDLTCSPSKYGTKIDSKGLADSHEKFGPIKVVAGAPLAFAVLYGESRQAQNRSCSFTASFTPSAGRAYTVQFASVNQSLACGMQISDESGAVVPYQAPEISCAETMAGKVKNGGAGVLNWEFRVIRY